jgi:hypothetical protein
MKRAMIAASVLAGVGAACLAMSFYTNWHRLIWVAVHANYPVVYVVTSARIFRHAEFSDGQWLVFATLASWLAWFVIFRIAFFVLEILKQEAPVVDGSGYGKAMALLTTPAEQPSTRATDWRCPKCGEMVPGNFDSCWSCSSEAPAKA